IFKDKPSRTLFHDAEQNLYYIPLKFCSTIWVHVTIDRWKKRIPYAILIELGSS
ncbi:unnamed protein product, partial [Sphenostylis stenocarpa]